jgi:hypothetical protein
MDYVRAPAEGNAKMSKKVNRGGSKGKLQVHGDKIWDETPSDPMRPVMIRSLFWVGVLGVAAALAYGIVHADRTSFLIGVGVCIISLLCCNAWAFGTTVFRDVIQVVQSVLNKFGKIIVGLTDETNTK